MSANSDSYDETVAVREFRNRYARKKQPSLDLTSAQEFKAIIYGYFRRHGRDFPWRHTTDPYQILVSEIMLQQTQTGRVVDKFGEFLKAFPTVDVLARSSLHDVLTVWQGMGYNRRGRHLHELAARVIETYNGIIPNTSEMLVRLPGIGRATAASIGAFAFNQPVIFIETNIRTVFIHFFFRGRNKVNDREILPLVETTLDRNNPRRWYSALMDYGAMLKKKRTNPSRKSVHHHKQTPFEGSRRQLRGLVLKTLLAHPGITLAQLARMAHREESEVELVIGELQKDGLIKRKGKILYC